MYASSFKEIQVSSPWPNTAGRVGRGVWCKYGVALTSFSHIKRALTSLHQSFQNITRHSSRSRSRRLSPTTYLESSMARLTNIVSASRDSAPSIDVASAELGQLLYRLQQTVLHPTPERERRLRTSEYERARLESVITTATLWKVR